MRVWPHMLIYHVITFNKYAQKSLHKGNEVMEVGNRYRKKWRISPEAGADDGALPFPLCFNLTKKDCASENVLRSFEWLLAISSTFSRAINKTSFKDFMVTSQE